MKESTLVDHIRKALTERGVKVIKIHGNQFMSAGEPDLIGCKDGRMYCWEVKVGSNTATALQIKRLAEWRATGAVTAVVRSVNDALNVLTNGRPTV